MCPSRWRCSRRAAAAWRSRSPSGARRPCCRIMMFAVFRSRWTIPASWIACRPSATWMRHLEGLARRGRPRSAERPAQVHALHELHGDVAQRPSSPYSWMRQTLRWRTLRASLISERKRRAISGARAISARSTLMATVSSSTRSWACRRCPCRRGRGLQDLVAAGEELPGSTRRAPCRT